MKYLAIILFLMFSGCSGSQYVTQSRFHQFRMDTMSMVNLMYERDNNGESPEFCLCQPARMYEQRCEVFLDEIRPQWREHNFTN
jgi:hypothetical protein